MSQGGLPQPGDVIDGTYRVESLLGSGGMGAVYRAWDRGKNAAVALKVLAQTLADDQARLRFKREGRIIESLDVFPEED